jgi:hypothetical protein
VLCTLQACVLLLVILRNHFSFPTWQKKCMGTQKKRNNLIKSRKGGKWVKKNNNNNQVQVCISRQLLSVRRHPVADRLPIKFTPPFPCVPTACRWMLIWVCCIILIKYLSLCSPNSPRMGSVIFLEQPPVQWFYKVGSQYNSLSEIHLWGHSGKQSEMVISSRQKLARAL